MYQAPASVTSQQGPTAMSTAGDDKVAQEHFDDFYEEVCDCVYVCARACTAYAYYPCACTRHVVDTVIHALTIPKHPNPKPLTSNISYIHA